ncbi:MAG: hypothetical protein BRD45_04000 [Bacteroidetes bacterium QS_8_64_10]|nr:MAG: hypothetical protein BRD45_04000 [Bacteroidetes bacterium QS_8_64_10]
MIELFSLISMLHIAYCVWLLPTGRITGSKLPSFTERKRAVSIRLRRVVFQLLIEFLVQPAVRFGRSERLAAQPDDVQLPSPAEGCAFQRHDMHRPGAWPLRAHVLPLQRVLDHAGQTADGRFVGDRQVPQPAQLLIEHAAGGFFERAFFFGNAPRRVHWPEAFQKAPAHPHHRRYRRLSVRNKIEEHRQDLPGEARAPQLLPLALRVQLLAIQPLDLASASRQPGRQRRTAPHLARVEIIQHAVDAKEAAPQHFDQERGVEVVADPVVETPERLTGARLKRGPPRAEARVDARRVRHVSDKALIRLALRERDLDIVEGRIGSENCPERGAYLVLRTHRAARALDTVAGDVGCFRRGRLRETGCRKRRWSLRAGIRLTDAVEGAARSAQVVKQCAFEHRQLRVAEHGEHRVCRFGTRTVRERFRAPAQHVGLVVELLLIQRVLVGSVAAGDHAEGGRGGIAFGSGEHTLRTRAVRPEHADGLCDAPGEVRGAGKISKYGPVEAVGEMRCEEAPVRGLQLRPSRREDAPRSEAFGVVARQQAREARRSVPPPRDGALDGLADLHARDEHDLARRRVRLAERPDLGNSRRGSGRCHTEPSCAFQSV